MQKKLPNEPILFIDSVSDKTTGEENQLFYDSRNNKKKKHALNRLEDIEAMLLYKINILCEIKTKTTLYEGVVIGVDEKYLYLIIDGNKISIDILNIEDINILRL